MFYCVELTWMQRVRAAGRLLSVMLLGIGLAGPVGAQQAAKPAATPSAAPGGELGAGGTTVVPRTGTDGSGLTAGTSRVRLEALLTADGQRIEQGLVWRVFSGRNDTEGKPKLIATHREANPVLKLPAGDYSVNVAFGRANLTRKIAAKSGEETSENFVLNAGGLRLTADVGGAAAPPNAITYAIQSDERDQFGNRATIMSGAKPGLIIRLNAGIYQLVSTYGDANAVVRADVTVEAGKLTEAAISHAAAKVVFKLVAQAGGDAVADTQWTIQTLGGEVVKATVGALPTHTLAPGSYAAIAAKGGKSYRRDFSVRAGDVVQVEVVIQ
jgi:hypothetical protein